MRICSRCTQGRLHRLSWTYAIKFMGTVPTSVCALIIV